MNVKVTEMVGHSDSGWKDAVQSAVTDASRSLNEVVAVEVVNFTANVENGRVTNYKANLKIAHKA
jgi:flavin-binding protein dodecin